MNDDAAILDIGDHDHGAVLAFELHADLNVRRKQFERFDIDQVGVVFAECLFRLQLDLQLVADVLAFQASLDVAEDVVIAAMPDQTSFSAPS